MKDRELIQGILEKTTRCTITEDVEDINENYYFKWDDVITAALKFKNYNSMGWTHIADSLPEKEGEYLCFHHNGFIGMGFFKLGENRESFEWQEIATDKQIFVSHWTPKPTF